MKKWMIAIALVVFGATLALAQDQPPRERRGPGMGPRPFVEMFGAQLSLTDAQKEQITGIEKKAHDDNTSVFEAARATMEEFRKAREANDTAKLESLKPVMDSQRAQLKTIHDAVLKQITATLTADQQAKLEKLRAEHEAQGQGHPRQ